MTTVGARDVQSYKVDEVDGPYFHSVKLRFTQPHARRLANFGKFQRISLAAAS
jgi:hypothetical protein